MLIQPLIAKESLSHYPNWIVESKEINKEFILKNFTEAIAFVNKLAVIADKMNHHPDIDIRYNKVKITLSTHDIGGISEKDIDLAKKIEKILT